MKMTLEEALRECLADDDKISKYEAEVLHGLVLADGKIDDHEKELLRKAINENHFDDRAYKILSDMLMRSNLSR